jgi:hypothetical protein
MEHAEDDQPSRRKRTRRRASLPGRFHTNEDTKRLVWVRAAGHCELCGTDLTHDFRIGVAMRWGEVAHILPASPRGPRAVSSHDAAQAQALTNDPSNLLLACPGCHDKIDRDDDGYPTTDLQGLHAAFVQRIQLAAKAPDGGKALALIFLSQHFDTLNLIRNQDLLTAMSAEGLAWVDYPIREVLPAPGSQGRDAHYWQQVTDRIQHALTTQLRRARSVFGDEPGLAVAGLADIPALMMLGQSIGDRSTRYLFSPNRGQGLRWSDPSAPAPDFLYRRPPDGTGPVALVLSLSATVPARDVEAALPGARIAELTVEQPSVALVKNRGTIEAFRDAIQLRLSELEASTAEPIHLFPSIPAVLAIEFGALQTMQYRHPYVIYDRHENNVFLPALELGHAPQEPTV